MILNSGWFHRVRSDSYALLLLSQASSLSKQSWKLVERQLQQQLGQQIWLKKSSLVRGGEKRRNKNQNEKTKMLLGPVHPVSNTQLVTWQQIPFLQVNRLEEALHACLSGEEGTFKNTSFCLSLKNIRMSIYWVFQWVLFMRSYKQRSYLWTVQALHQCAIPHAINPNEVRRTAGERHCLAA